MLKYSHATHNKKISNLLYNSKEECSDWVVTTSYYSAYHYLKSFLFPGTFFCHKRRRDYEFSSFEEYYKSYKTVNFANRHEAMNHIVDCYLEDLADSCQFLKDGCIEARYYNYQVPPKKAEESLNELNVISDYIEKNTEE